MIVTNKKTGKDVSSDYLELMEGKITKDEFEKRAGIDRCEMCKEELDEDNFIKSDNQRCDDCYEEWGDEYPDRL